ncbi:MAG: hypothetical protein KJ697_03515 [Nanoarchaeota archaeon]|nr:hypothetical protein [Nanoarchaeota archaeon]MBU4124119.1 hypothetical protein [Nanoarchaeota archaeon]
MINPNVSQPHNQEVEKTKMKARSFIKKIIIISQSTSLIVGKLQSADIDKMGATNYPACKLTVFKPKRYSIGNTFQFNMEDQGIYFVNKPEMIMTLDEISDKYPEIFREIHINVGKGVWDGA